MSVQAQKAIIRGVPLILLTREDARKAPLVFIVHGFASRKEQTVELGYRLAEAGLAAVCLDAALHGERLDERMRDTFLHPLPGDTYPFESGLDRLFLMFEAVQRTVSDISLLLDEFASDPRLDPQRAGIGGSSMGGFIAYCAAAAEPRIRAIVPQISIGNFAERWDDMLLEASINPQWTAAMQKAAAESARRSAWVRAEIDPVARLKTTFAPRPLLMQCGNQDLDLHKSYSVHLYRELLLIYAEKPEQLRLKIYDGAAHRVNTPMMEDAVQWFGMYL